MKYVTYLCNSDWRFSFKNIEEVRAVLVEQKCQCCQESLHIIHWYDERSVLRCENSSCRRFLSPIPTGLYLGKDGKIYTSAERAVTINKLRNGYHWLHFSN